MTCWIPFECRAFSLVGAARHGDDLTGNGRAAPRGEHGISPDIWRFTMSELNALIDTHLAAHAHPDSTHRAGVVQRIWAEDAQLIDPPLAATGHAQIVQQADQLLAQFPGHSFKRSSGIDNHHGMARYAWQLIGPTGAVALEGIDIAQVNSEGRLAQVAGFFGPLAAL
jgi:hypothetical protein